MSLPPPVRSALGSALGSALVIALLLAPPSGVAGQDAGGPADAGRAQDAGQLADAGHAQDAGQLADAGTTEDAGQHADAGPLADATGLPDPLPEALRPDIEVTVEPATDVMTGDLVTLRITVTANVGDEVAVPEQSLSPFEILSTERSRDDGDPEHPRFRIELGLLALSPGDHLAGPVRLQVVTADGTLGSVETDPVPVHVGSVLGNEPNAEPKPPSEPVEVLEEDYTLAWIGGALVILLLLAVAMFFLARWWLGREKPAAPPPPPRPPWIIAIEKLEALAKTLATRTTEPAADLSAPPPEVVGWVDELSDTTREYLGDRFGFEGLESTTDEVLSRLRKQPPKGIAIEEVAALLGDCDLVKFAKATPGKEQCEALLAAGYRIVRATVPSAAPSTPSPPSGGPTALPPTPAANVSAGDPEGAQGSGPLPGGSA